MNTAPLRAPAHASLPQMSTLQIGMTASRHGISGTDRYFLELLRALPNLGVAVRGVVMGDPTTIEDPVAGVESFAPVGATRLRRWMGLRRSVSRYVGDANLVVSHGAPHTFLALDKLGARPLVVHFHGPWALEGKADGIGPLRVLVRRIQEKSVYARGARFIVLSRAFGSILEREYGVPPSLVRVIPGGVELGRFRVLKTKDEARVALGLPRDRRIVVTVRRLVQTKGVENLIAAIDTVRRTAPDVLLLIAGAGPLAESFRQQVARAGLEAWVRFMGLVPDHELPLLYRAGDLFVVPTVALEGFGLVVVESLACGTPVLVTPVGGLPEAVADLDSRLVMRGSDAASLAAGITDALEGRIALPDEAACIAYAQRFSWPVIAERVASIYREAYRAGT